MKRELKLFFIALMFYTRIPCPENTDHNASDLNKSTRYFPLMGWIVGGISALVYYGAVNLVSQPLAIIFSMVTSILLTGAFHEDGFADVCDGFGGGWNKEHILHIMKDSRLGTYGTVGLFFILITKFLLLNEFATGQLVLILPVAHSFSRFASVVTIFRRSYVRDEEGSKAKPIGQSITISEFILAALFGFTPMFLLLKPVYWLLVAPVILVSWLMSRYFRKWIGGYTGDCLGAIQQVSEITVYLGFLLIINLL